jgi:hypothetical protein
MAIIRNGIDSIVRSSITHTDDITADMFAAVGASMQNSELRLNGVAYNGPLSETDEVLIVQRANSKGL